LRKAASVTPNPGQYRCGLSSPRASFSVQRGGYAHVGRSRWSVESPVFALDAGDPFLDEFFKCKGFEKQNMLLFIQWHIATQIITLIPNLGATLDLLTNEKPCHPVELIILFPLTAENCCPMMTANALNAGKSFVRIHTTPTGIHSNMLLGNSS
jgi:hypothetical protein